MSKVDENGTVDFEAPVSTMIHGSLACGQGDVDLFWPGQHGMYNYPMDQLARRMYEKDRLEFFCMREILFHGKEIGKSQKAASLDRFWGVRMVWPYRAKKGHRYLFTFQGEEPELAPGQGMVVNDLEMPDVILINGEKYWERSFGESLLATIEFIAREDTDMVLTLVKDRHRCKEDAYRGWGNLLAIVHANCRGYAQLHLGLKYACEHFGPTDQAPTQGEPYSLPDGMRRFMNPGPWQWVADETVPEYAYEPVRKPDYPTDNVVWINFHDTYIDEPRCGGTRRIIGNPEVMRQLVQLSLDNGIHGFAQHPSVLRALEELGHRDDPDITIWFSGGYLKRTRVDGQGHISGGLAEVLKDDERLNDFLNEDGTFTDSTELQQLCRKISGKEIVEVLAQFPNSPVIYRINEFSGCQYSHVVSTPEDRQRSWPKEWYAFTKVADDINREALDELLADARGVDAGRLTVAANVQTEHLSSHPLHVGADFIMEKTIGRQNVNLVVANSRGVNTAFNRRIGLQHDAWGGLNYNRDSAAEIEAIHRSFFFNGVDVSDAEFGNFALTRDGRGVFNQKGMAWIKTTRLAAIHPRRGQQRVKIGFIAGSDQIWGWYYPTKHTLGLRGFDGYDPKEPKEFVDFELLDIAFPGFGKWHSFNPMRFLTGTPYGPCDVIPADAPATSLQRYQVLSMLGANRVEESNWQNYIEYVRNGGTLIMGLYQLLAPDDDRVYFKTDLADLLGIKLGEDCCLNSWERMTSMAEFQTFISEHYNRVEMAGAETIERLPNGDPLLCRFSLGKGYAYFFTTDRLTTMPDVADALVRSLFEKNKPVNTVPGNDRIEISISEKGDLRIITLMDHGRGCLPTNAGTDSGPYCGTVKLNLAALGLPDGEYDVLQVKTDDAISTIITEPLDCRQSGRSIEVSIEAMANYCELVVGPKGKTEQAFFWT